MTTHVNPSFSSPSSSSSKIDDAILDCYLQSTDILIHGRQAIILPKSRRVAQFSDNADYCKQLIKGFWKLNPHQSLVIDLFVNDSVDEKYHIFEQWCFQYQRKDSNRSMTSNEKEMPLNLATAKIVTFLRTLYSFVRLLPGFQLLHQTSKLSTIAFDIYASDPSAGITGRTSFGGIAASGESTGFSGTETATYDFPRIGFSRGSLQVGVKYLDSYILQVCHNIL